MNEKELFAEIMEVNSGKQPRWVNPQFKIAIPGYFNIYLKGFSTINDSDNVSIYCIKYMGGEFIIFCKQKNTYEQ